VAAFERLFDPAAVARVDEVTVRLDDPARGTIVAPPVAARHAGHGITFLRLRVSGAGTHDIVAPARASVRRVRVDPATPLPGAITEVLELSVLPFGAAATITTLTALAAGAPTFYVAPFTELSQALPPPAIDDAFVDAGTPLVSLAGSDIVCIGVLFQDGVTLAPAAALSSIGDALDAAGDLAGATTWRTQLDVFGARPSFHVRRHDGSLITAGTQIDVELRDGGGIAVAAGTLALGADGDLEAAIAAAPIGALTSLFAPPSNHHVALRWRGEPLVGEALPVHALHGTTGSAPPGSFLDLPASTTPHATMLVLDLANWFPPLVDGLNVSRFHTNSRIEPLVDGIPTYKRLIADMQQAVHRDADGNVQFRLHLAAWALLTFNLDPANRVFDTDIVTFAAQIHDAGGRVLVLPTRFLNIHDDSLDDTRFLVILLLVILNDATLIGMLLASLTAESGTFATSDWVTFTWFALPAVAGILLEAGTAIGPVREWIIEQLEGVVENALEAMDALNALDALPGETIAIQSPNPARISDNPLAPLYGPGPFFGAEDDCDQFNVYHNKVQMIRRRRDPDTEDEYVAYLGGIDINPNRLDTPGHQINSPYHDVHARITGPVVADVFASFYERWIRDAHLDRAAFEDELPPARPDDMPRHDASRHIARIGRTYPKVSPPYDFAPDGDRTIFDTLVAAIDQARDYIYIEDQYFAPHDVFIDALRAAALTSRCKRLLITVPDIADQPFADLRRRHVLDALGDAWGDRMLVGFPQRRPRLLRSDRFASRGRAWLASACGAGDGEIFVAPHARVTAPPFWLWVDGELMLARDVVGPVQQEGVMASRVAVERGAVSGRPRWGAHTRPHRKNAPVTFSQAKGIYIHAKCMMIDDVFVSIGSANLNRRGFFSDGEINVFAIPEQLRAAPDNPARALRTALWAEHLGIAPAMGASLLRDPIASFERFFHPRLAGNRFTPLGAGDIQPDFGVADAQIFPLALAGLAASLVGAAPSVFLRRAWNLAVDPTTGTDPAPTEGPV